MYKDYLNTNQLNYTRQKNLFMINMLLLSLVVRLIIDYFNDVSNLYLFTIFILGFSFISLSYFLHFKRKCKDSSVKKILVISSNLICILMFELNPSMVMFICFFYIFTLMGLYEDSFINTFCFAIMFPYFVLIFERFSDNVFLNQNGFDFMLFLLYLTILYLGMQMMSNLKQSTMKEIYNLALENKEIAEKNSSTIQEIEMVTESLGALNSDMNTLISSNVDMSAKVHSNAESLAETVDSLGDKLDVISDAIVDSTEQMSFVAENMEQIYFSTKIGTEIGNANVNRLKDLNTEISKIHELIKKVSVANKALNDHSTKIDDSILELHSIANQVKLLSFNAAIQSAQAGEHGKGFSVVASEMNKLSDESVRFTKIIEGLVKEKAELEEDLKNIISEESSLIKSSINNLTESLDGIEEQHDNILSIKENMDVIHAAISMLNRNMGYISASTCDVTDLSVHNRAFIQNILSSMSEQGAMIDNSKEHYKIMEEVILILRDLI